MPCEQGSWSRRLPLATDAECTPCAENTAANLVRSACVAAPGYYGDGRECPEGFYCFQGRRYKWWVRLRNPAKGGENVVGGHRAAERVSKEQGDTRGKTQV